MGLGWSVHKNDGWRGQFERVHRWRIRLLEATRSKSPDLEDFAYAFFQNCYHLREWIEKTSSCPQSELDALMATSAPLRLCRDIANGTKHRTLQHASVDTDFSIGREYAPDEPAGYRLFLIADDKYDLIDLSRMCISAWTVFIEEKGAMFGSRKE